MENVENGTAGVNIGAALSRHEAARLAYLEKREQFASLGERLEKHKKTAQAAWTDAEAAKEEWRAQLRAKSGEIDKALRKVRLDEVSARELAQEYDLIIQELSIAYEVCRLDLYDLRLRYVKCRRAAVSAYGDACLAGAFTALCATPEWNDFAAELLRAGLLDSENPKRTGGKLLSLVSANDLAAPEAPELKGAWVDLVLEPELAAESIERAPMESMIARKKARESLLARAPQ